jgi:peptidoglycan/xylan/chitin deacetylase (PgdA/CDA1 family)
MINYLVYICAVACWVGLTGCNPSNQRDDISIQAKPTAKIDVIPADNSAAQIMSLKQVPVLCYHRIAHQPKGIYTVSPEAFESQMQLLADSGYVSILPAQLYDYLVHDVPLPHKPVMLTFDDSRAEHFAIAAPVMEKYQFRGVFFIMTITCNKPNYLTKPQIAQLAKAGHAIGLHSWDHHRVTQYITPDDWQKQVISPQAMLETLTGQPIDVWAYPYGIYNHESAQVLSQYFRLSFILSGQRDPLLPLQTIRRIVVTECSGPQLLKRIRQWHSDAP